MPEVLRVADEAALAAAEQALRAGNLVVFPTDTVFGLAAHPDAPGATDRLFEAKRRPRDLTLPVLAASVADAERVAAFDDRARSLAETFWPGGLTIVLPRTVTSAEWDLGEKRDTIGVRVPANDVAGAVLSRTGPLAATSANRSGGATPSTCDDLPAIFGDAVAVYLCAGEPGGGVHSTVVDLTGPRPRVVREGAIPGGTVLASLA